MLDSTVQAELAAILPPAALLAVSRGDEAVRVRWSDAVSRAARRGRAARERGAGRRDSEGVPRGARSRGRARRGDQPVGRRAARSRGRRAVAREVQAHPRHRPDRAHRGRAAGRAQSRDLRGRGGVRSLLRARSLVADRVLDRRQRRRERGRRALPEVRPHRAQRAPRARRAHHRRRRSSSAANRSTAPATTCWRSSPAARDCSPSSPRSPSSCCPSRSSRRWRWPRSTTSRRRARRWARSSAPASSRRDSR